MSQPDENILVRGDLPDKLVHVVHDIDYKSETISTKCGRKGMCGVRVNPDEILFHSLFGWSIGEVCTPCAEHAGLKLK